MCSCFPSVPVTISSTESHKCSYFNPFIGVSRYFILLHLARSLGFLIPLLAVFAACHFSLTVIYHWVFFFQPTVYAYVTPISFVFFFLLIQKMVNPSISYAPFVLFRVARSWFSVFEEKEEHVMLTLFFYQVMQKMCILRMGSRTLTASNQ